MVTRLFNPSNPVKCLILFSIKYNSFRFSIFWSGSNEAILFLRSDNTFNLEWPSKLSIFSILFSFRFRTINLGALIGNSSVILFLDRLSVYNLRNASSLVNGLRSLTLFYSRFRDVNDCIYERWLKSEILLLDRSIVVM